MRLLLLITILQISFNIVFACSPYGYPNPPLSFVVAKTDKIYIGKVISTSSVIKNRGDSRYKLIRIKFSVEKALKGIDNNFQEIALEVPLKKYRNSCFREPPKFKKGEMWIIEDNSSQSADIKYFIVGFIGQYGNYSKYSPERHQSYIQKLETAVKNPVTAIYGEVQTFWAYSYISDAVVVAKGNGAEFSTKTNEDGKYSFENIPPGNYKVQIRLPFKSENFFGRHPPVFDEQTKTYFLEYNVSIKSGDSDYYFAVVSDKN